MCLKERTHVHTLARPALAPVHALSAHCGITRAATAEITKLTHPPMIRHLTAWALLLSWAQQCSAEGAAVGFASVPLSADVMLSPSYPSPPAFTPSPSTIPSISLYHVAFASLAVLIHSGKFVSICGTGGLYPSPLESVIVSGRIYISHLYFCVHQAFPSTLLWACTSRCSYQQQGKLRVAQSSAIWRP